MNILLTRFWQLWPLLLLPLLLPYSLTSRGEAALVKGEMKWEDQGGYVNIISNTVGAINVTSTRPCPISCTLTFANRGGDYDLINLTPQTTLAQLIAAIRHTGRTSVPSSSGTLCRTLYVAVSQTRSYMQDYPLGCFDNPNLGVPPTNPTNPTDPPQTALSCSISSGTINHGQLASTDVNGHKANASVTVDCNRQANVWVRAERGYDPAIGLTLQGPGTIKSAIFIDDVASAETGVKVNVNTSRRINVLSVLRGAATGITGGSYSGSLVLVASII